MSPSVNAELYVKENQVSVAAHPVYGVLTL